MVQFLAYCQIAINMWRISNPPRVDPLCTAPIRVPRFVVIATWGLNLWIADGGDYHEFFERAPLGYARNDRCATV